MTNREFIASLTNDEKQSRINDLLTQLRDAHTHDDVDRAKRIRHALRLHDYKLRERRRVYDVQTNTIL